MADTNKIFIVTKRAYDEMSKGDQMVIDMITEAAEFYNAIMENNKIYTKYADSQSTISDEDKEELKELNAIITGSLKNYEAIKERFIAEFGVTDYPEKANIEGLQLAEIAHNDQKKEEMVA